jgi:hypothetical protein
MAAFLAGDIRRPGLTDRAEVAQEDAVILSRRLDSRTVKRQINRITDPRAFLRQFLRMSVSAAVMIAATAHGAESRIQLPAGYRPVYFTDFTSGIDGGLMQQKPRGESLMAVAAPGNRSGKVLRASIEKGDDFSRVANGAPRAELSLGPRFRFQLGREYLIDWSIYLPNEYEFDSRQPEGITQIHQGPSMGSPPFSISLAGSHYLVELRSPAGGQLAVDRNDIGDARTDKGQWVGWRLRYVPDATGVNGRLELFKDGALILDRNGSPNAYAGDNNSYFKIGIYKWWWKERPSDVTSRTLYFGDVTIAIKE